MISRYSRLSAFLVALLVMTGVATVSRSAYADATPRVLTIRVDVTISSTRTALTEGDSVIVSGRARHAELGTWVKLQRRVAGVWQAAGMRQRISDRRRYLFTFNPPRGHQRYRVVTIARRHQPAANSLAIPLSVSWQPSVTATGTPVTDSEGSQWVDITGQVLDGPSNATVELRRLDWSTGQAVTLQVLHPDGATPFSVQRQTRDQGYTYELVLDATPLTFEASSSVVDDGAPPFVLPLNGGLRLQNLPESGDAVAAEVGLDLQAGQQVSVAGSESALWDADVRDPAGGHVTTLHGICSCTVTSTTFTAATTGRYLLDLQTYTANLTVQLWASTPKVIDTNLDADPVSVTGDIPGQTVDLRFPVDADQAFTLADNPDNWTSRVVRDPAGSALTTWISRNVVHRDLYHATDSGTFGVEYTSSNGVVDAGPVRLLSATQQTATLDGAPIQVDIDDPARIGLVWAQLNSGDVLSVKSGLDTTEMIQTNGSFGPTAPGIAGKHVVVVQSCCVNATGSATVRAGSPLPLTATIDGDPASYDLTGWAVRAVDLTFTGANGQVVERAASPASSLDTSQLYDPSGNPLTPIAHGAYQLPADGTYLLRTYFHTAGTGNVGVRSVPVTDVPTDGTPTIVTLAHGDGVALGAITAPPGTPIDATLAHVDNNLGTQWVVLITDSHNHNIDFWTEALLTGNRPPDTRPTFPVPSDGTVYFALYSTNNTTGSITLNAVVH